MDRSIFLVLVLFILLCQSSIYSQNNKINLNDAQLASIMAIVNKKVALNDDQSLEGVLLITKENLVNGNIWAIAGSIVIHKVKLKKDEPNENNETEKIETVIEFDEVILRTKSKKGVGSTLDIAVNALIESIAPEDITITN
jgi:hypothetical protein